MAEQVWLLFTPQTPTTPSSLRVAVWRRLQGVGAVSMQQGMWMLPRTPEHEQFIRDMLAELQSHGGSGLFLVATTLDPSSESQIIARFQAERAKDYVEFDGRCQDFFREIDQEMADHHWTFAELEENEEDLAKLTSWLRKIQSRDFFPGPHSAQAARQLVRCRQMLDTFMHAVYTAIGLETQAEQGVDEAEYTGETLTE